MRVLVLGAAGMLGHKLLGALQAKFPDTWAAMREPFAEIAAQYAPLFRRSNVIDQLDASDFAQVERRLRENHPDVVVNCIGVVKQRPAAQQPLPSITINALLPHQLLRICSEWGAKVIHFSTDCVFNGKEGAYDETSISNAEDLYGRTKFLGEIDGPRALTLRTSFIGRELRHHQSLLEWFLRHREGTVRGFTRAFYAGVTTNHLARLVAEIIENHPDLVGLYQVASSPISKYELLCMLRDAYRRNVEIVPDASLFCDRSMSGEKLFAKIGYRSPPWPELIRELLHDATPYGR